MLLSNANTSTPAVKKRFRNPPQSHAAATVPPNHDTPTLPAAQLLESKLQTHASINHDRGVTGMNSAAHVPIEHAVIELQHLHAGAQKALPRASLAADHMTGD